MDFEGRDVALKVMQNMKRTVWEREKRIYETDMLRHPNILGFIASDINQSNVCFQETYCFVKFVVLFNSNHKCGAVADVRLSSAWITAKLPH